MTEERSCEPCCPYAAGVRDIRDAVADEERCSVPFVLAE
tara:strand:- start:968 stop:1084 length:117 start_codon:yes stop_codon:yes gene_type:complete